MEAALAKLPNKNRPSDYRWMEALLSLIALNAAPAVRDLHTGASGAPLFIMAGACPSVFAGMQTVVFASMRPPGAAPYPSHPPTPTPTPTPLPPAAAGAAVDAADAVDFWWLKPQRDDPSALEQATLNRHASGPHRNDPGASRKVYAPIAQLFSTGLSVDGKLRFGVALAGNGAPRAYIECVESRVRYYLCWVWLEDWSSPVSFGKKFMKGKLLYQKDPADGSGYYARPFRFLEDRLLLPPGEAFEERVGSVLPDDQVKLGCVV